MVDFPPKLRIDSKIVERGGLKVFDKTYNIELAEKWVATGSVALGGIFAIMVAEGNIAKAELETPSLYPPDPFPPTYPNQEAVSISEYRLLTDTLFIRSEDKSISSQIPQITDTLIRSESITITNE